MDAELKYGNLLNAIPSSNIPKNNGFAKDDGASLKTSFIGINEEMGREGNLHLKVAESISNLIIKPFTQWSFENKQRIDYSSSLLKNMIKQYLRHENETDKSKKKYFNKCRVLEEERTNLQEEEEEAKKEELNNTPSSATTAVDERDQSPGILAKMDGQHQNSDDESYDSDDDDFEVTQFGSIQFDSKHLKELFIKMLDEIPMNPYKIPILGTYENVSLGTDIMSWIQGNTGLTKISDAESFGQDLANKGYLRLVGQVGNNFANSSNLHYQWKNQAFITAGKQQSISLTVGTYFEGVINTTKGIHNGVPETLIQKLTREVSELENKYENDVEKLDDLRCDLEENISEHLKFFEKCELDRLRILKQSVSDFTAIVGNNVSSLKSVVDKLMLYEETIKPENDLSFLLQNYHTCAFVPKVTIFDNYYQVTAWKIFGTAIETRCRTDKKNVPLIISAILSYMDSIYPIMKNDSERQNVWLLHPKLKDVHLLRKSLNKNELITREKLVDYDPIIITSVLKLYLLELPDSLIPSDLYDVFRTIYSQYGNNGLDSPNDSSNGNDQTQLRLSAIQNTLAALPKCNIATLDSIARHFTRLIKIIKLPISSSSTVGGSNSDQSIPEKQEESQLKGIDIFKNRIAQEFSMCIIRPKIQTNITLGDKHGSKLMIDILNYREIIFADLRRRGSSRKSSRTSSRVSSGVLNSFNDGRVLSGSGLISASKFSMLQPHPAIPPKVQEQFEAPIHTAKSNDSLGSSDSGNSPSSSLNRVAALQARLKEAVSVASRTSPKQPGMMKRFSQSSVVTTNTPIIPQGVRHSKTQSFASSNSLPEIQIPPNEDFVFSNNRTSIKNLRYNSTSSLITTEDDKAETSAKLASVQKAKIKVDDKVSPSKLSEGTKQLDKSSSSSLTTEDEKSALSSDQKIKIKIEDKVSPLRIPEGTKKLETSSLQFSFDPQEKENNNLSTCISPGLRLQLNSDSEINESTDSFVSVPSSISPPRTGSYSNPNPNSNSNSEQYKLPTENPKIEDESITPAYVPKRRSTNLTPRIDKNGNIILVNTTTGEVTSPTKKSSSSSITSSPRLKPSISPLKRSTKYGSPERSSRFDRDSKSRHDSSNPIVID